MSSSGSVSFCAGNRIDDLLHLGIVISRRSSDANNPRPSHRMASINNFWTFCLVLLLIAYPLVQVARCQSDGIVETTEEGSDVGIVGINDASFPSAPGIDTFCLFPKNSAKLVPAGEERDLLVGVKNDGKASLNVIAVKATVHLPYDHRFLVQNLSAQVTIVYLFELEFHRYDIAALLSVENGHEDMSADIFLLLSISLRVPFPHQNLVFNYATVPASAQATFPYIFSVSQFMQSGTFDLVGTIIYEIDQHQYQSTFYNGTIEVVDSGSLLSMESVFLSTLGVALLALLVLWIYGQVQSASKKSKKGAKVEVGTRATSMDEWLEVHVNALVLYYKSKTLAII
ncbi:translocon-associated protein subunit alpha-like [Senna tora]|uniref:Translocon-associated protein subunit alpha-like n=1 Tax=Senna tora TaxID=362788 RepID=A0A834SVX7_9FABA|nr:translocon-associated protein subunit alpha-like [Senna tora]